jgi:hypothetical protein
MNVKKNSLAILSQSAGRFLIPVWWNLKEQAICTQTKLDPRSEGWISSAVFRWEPMSGGKGPLRTQVQPGFNPN